MKFSRRDALANRNKREVGKIVEGEEILKKELSRERQIDS